MRVRILGCGPSGGVPGISYGWGNCDPENPRNRRMRPSILVEKGDAKILVDTSPDLREQALAANISALDAVLYTHGHADHLHGIDDLRSINRLMDSPLDCFSDEMTLETIRRRFAYAFTPLPESSAFYFKPTLTPHIIKHGQDFEVEGITIHPMIQDHGYGQSLGFLFDGRMAYSTDLVDMPEENFEKLRGIDLWIMGVLTDDPAPTHLHVEKAREWIDRVKPARAIFTHMGPALDYEALIRDLPANIRPAHDGMVIDLDENKLCE